MCIFAQHGGAFAALESQVLSWCDARDCSGLERAARAQVRGAASENAQTQSRRASHGSGARNAKTARTKWRGSCRLRASRSWY